MGFLKSAIAMLSVASAVTSCSTTSGRWCSADSWTFEDSSGEAELNFIGDTLEIVSPDGHFAIRLWKNRVRITDFRISGADCAAR